MSIISLTLEEAKGILRDMVKDANKAMLRYVIMNHGKPEAVIMSYEEYECWIKTLDILNNDL